MDLKARKRAEKRALPNTQSFQKFLIKEYIPNHIRILFRVYSLIMDFLAFVGALSPISHVKVSQVSVCGQILQNRLRQIGLLWSHCLGGPNMVSCWHDMSNEPMTFIVQLVCDFDVCCCFSVDHVRRASRRSQETVHEFNGNVSAKIVVAVLHDIWLPHLILSEPFGAQTMDHVLQYSCNK